MFMANTQGIVLTNRGNQTEGKHIHNYSSFDKGQLSYRLYNTLRFGDYTPSFVMDGVECDEISINSKDIIDSLSLNAPFKSRVRKIKESFMVPLMALLPMNWDRIYVQPSNGDDVPANANCVLEDFPNRFKTFWASMINGIQSNYPSSTNYSQSIAIEFYNAVARALVTGEYVYSFGSLPHVCGYKIASTFTYYAPDGTRYNYDDFFDESISAAFGRIKFFRASWQVGNSTEYRDFAGLSSEAPTGGSYSSFRSYLEALRENPLISITSVEYDSTFGTNPDYQAVCSDIWNTFASTGTPAGFWTGSFFVALPQGGSDDLMDTSDTNFNVSRLLAYQMVCAHFYSNSSVDVLYTAELYRQYVYMLYTTIFATTTLPNFVQNGIFCNYDFLSGRFLSSIFYMNRQGTTVTPLSYSVLSLNDPTQSAFANLYRLVGLSAVFGFRKSLRYGDYFVGSRPRPLAPINTDVSVNNSMVSVIDITRKIQVQRFANSVMRSRQKIEEYVKSLFGNAPAPDYHNPFFLSREEESVFGDEVQNTADTQMQSANSRTALFSSNSGQFTFTFHNDDMHPCVYLQIVSFDIRRAYTRSVERQFFIKDRYDMFNPDFQYIGDQPVYGFELGYQLQNGVIPQVFGYQTRDEEWKQRYDQASGGFVKKLPGWILTDDDMSRFSESNASLTPDFIRSYNTEFDQFFLSLTGLSLGNYWHFVCITDNNVIAKRAMAVDPQILQ